MGAKAWFVAYFDNDPKEILAKKPNLDRSASRELVERLFPGSNPTELQDGTLQFLEPSRRQVFVGCYGGLSIVAHGELGNDRPSRIDSRWFDPGLGSNAYVHATHSVVDWFAFGLWHKGKMTRAVSVAPDDGVIEQFGEPFSFEKPYWDGQHKVEFDDGEDPYPLPFHPLELSEASLLHHLGFQFEGYPDDWICDPSEIPIAVFTVSRRLFWKFW